MTTSTKTKPDTLEHVQIESGSARFVPPSADLLPAELHDARDNVLTCRTAWLEALNVKRAADRVANDAKNVHKTTLNHAALEGVALSEVVDERAAKYAAQEQATEHAKAALAAAETRWRQLIDGIGEHRAQIVDDITPAVVKAEDTLIKLEQAAAGQRRTTERLRSQRSWLASVGRATTGRASTENGSPFLP